MMQEDDLKSIIITIAGRPFPVKVDIDESVYVKDLENEINISIINFQKTYPARDKLDCVIMTLLTYIFDLKKKSTSEDQEGIAMKLNAINDILKHSDFH